MFRLRGLECLGCLGVLALLLVCGCDAPTPRGTASASRAEPRAAGDREAPLPAPGRVDPGEPAAPFQLTDSQGAPFDSASLRGRVWLASVFFANCPGPCFRENQAIADLLKDIPDPDLVAVSLTCDPDNDTPDVLRRYADRFQADPARWKLLTGDMNVIREVANKTFLLPAEVGVHSERGVVFDRQGRLRGSFHLLQADRVELLKKLILEVLAESSPDAPAGETP